MSDVQVSTQAEQDEPFGCPADANVDTVIPGALQVSLKSGVSTPSFMSDLRDHVFTHDVGVAITDSTDRTDIRNTSLTNELEYLQPGMTYKQQFLDTNTIAVMDNTGVINALEGYGLVAIANRLKYLYDVTEEDEEYVKLNSLHGFTAFVIKNRNIHPPQITVTDDGLIQAVWKHPQQGTLVMDFQESGDIAFTLLYGKWDQGTKRHKLIGELPQDQTILHVKDFIYDVMRT